MSRRSHVSKLYAPRVQLARARITDDPMLARVLTPDAESRLVLAFLIQLSALGRHLSTAHETLIQHITPRCRAVGRAKLGRELTTRARREAAYRGMSGEDLEVLVPRWNRHHSPQLCIDTLLDAAPTEAMQAYLRVHMRSLEGPLPFALLAMEVELEHLAAHLGPALEDACESALGPELAGELAILEGFAPRRGSQSLATLDRLLTEAPELAKDLARAGASSLSAFIDILDDCVSRAESIAAYGQLQAHQPRSA